MSAETNLEAKIVEALGEYWSETGEWRDIGAEVVAGVIEFTSATGMDTGQAVEVLLGMGEAVDVWTLGIRNG